MLSAALPWFCNVFWKTAYAPVAVEPSAFPATPVAAVLVGTNPLGESAIAEKSSDVLTGATPL
jgi:hypothetical protein